MPQNLFLKRNWRMLLTVATFIALIVFCIAIRNQLAVTIANLNHVRLWALLLLIPIEVLSYHAVAKVYQGIFQAVDERVSYWALLRVSLELNFVNHTFPSGGVSGISYFGFKMQEYGVRPTKATLAQTMRLLLINTSFEILLVVAVLALAIHGRASGMVIAIAAGITLLIACGTALFIYLIGSLSRINSFLTSITKFVNRVIHIFRPDRSEMIDVVKARAILGDFHRDYVLLQSRYKELAGPIVWALIGNIAEVAAVYTVYVAFGAYVNIGAVILAYAVANFAGFASVLPGGAGVYELLMTAVLAATGVPARLSLPVTIMYRVCNTLIQIPAGYILYHLTLHRTPKTLDIHHA